MAARMRASSASMRSSSCNASATPGRLMPRSLCSRCALHAHYGGRSETPLRPALLARLDHTLLDQLHHPICLHAAGARQIGESDLVSIIEDDHGLLGVCRHCSTLPHSGARVERQFALHLPIEFLGLVGVGRRRFDLQNRVHVAGRTAGCGRPLPLRRIVRPLVEPGGILRITAPSGVGAVALVPSAASHGVMGSSI